jgi:dolichol-phosphate mannosyltransferase
MDVSIVVPVCNEQDNVLPLAEEVAAALHDLRYELIFVDDGSSDATGQRVLEARALRPDAVRLLQHSRRRGQSAAVHSGVQAARAAWIGTLDGDGQNDPADLPRLYARRSEAPLIMGHRVSRQDTALRRWQSRIANAVRAAMLGDGTPDTGCGIKLFDRAMFLALPRFDHMHRFLPALFIRDGGRVLSVPVGHRPRQRGRSKYGLFDRLGVGIVDLFGVRWLMRRHRADFTVTEVDSQPSGDAGRDATRADA